MMFTRSQLTHLLIPLIIEQLLTVLVGMADVVMVGLVGEAAVSGVSLVDSISVLIIQMMAALATGGAVVSAQFIGRKRMDRARRTAGQLLFISLAFALTVMAAALIFRHSLLKLIFGQVEPAVMESAQTYFWISALSYPFLAVYSSCAALFRSMGNSKISMKVSAIMNLINVVGNVFCVVGLGMGVEGVAIPTLLSRVFAGVAMFWLIQRPGNEIRIGSLKEMLPNGLLIRKVLNFGVPNSLESGMFQFGKVALQSLVSTLGTAAIASYAVAFNLVNFLYLPGNAIGLGLITVVGQCVGAGEYGQVKRYTNLLLKLNYAILAVLCTVMIVLNHQLVAFYNLSPEASALASKLLFAHCIAMVIWPPAFALPNTLRASGDVRFTMCVSVSSMWICRIGLAYVFVKYFGGSVLSIWYAMFTDWFVRLVIYLWRYRKMKFKRV